MTYNFHEGRLFGRGIISISPVKILLADVDTLLHVNEEDSIGAANPQL
jgi:hypothetical protein